VIEATTDASGRPVRDFDLNGDGVVTGPTWLPSG
jgi:hypothetical protein